MYQTQISQNYEKAIIIPALLNPFHNDTGTVNDHISVLSQFPLYFCTTERKQTILGFFLYNLFRSRSVKHHH